MSILGTPGYEINIFLVKMAKLFANSRDLDQTQCSAASDLGLHCLPITLLWVFRLQWVKAPYLLYNYIFKNPSVNLDLIQ